MNFIYTRISVLNCSLFEVKATFFNDPMLLQNELYMYWIVPDHKCCINCSYTVVLHLQHVASTTHSKKSGIGLHTSSMAAQNSGKGQTGPPMPVGHHGLGGIPIDPPPPFLFVDSVDVIEIVVCLTSFSKWLDPPQPIFRERGRESGSNSGEYHVIEIDTTRSFML